MGKVYFLFGVHNHQPVGNFDYIFKEAFDKCYCPFIDTLEKYPLVKCNVHISGSLYDWLLPHHPEFIAKIKMMVAQGRIEIMSGGYYEPILPIIPDKDKLAQIRLMNQFVKKTFKVSPKGIWLAERVWEPYLARIINQASLQYTFLDDTHFRYAGLMQDNFFGYYTSCDEGRKIIVFPISKTLRYKIPFSKVEETIALLKSFSQSEDVLVTLFDDGEKFGLWPGTFDWVYNKGWLDNFFRQLSDNISSISTITASSAKDRFSSGGLIYLPTASYEEMGEWVLTPESFSCYEELKNYIGKSGKSEYKYFLRGGVFRNFYAKYPRLNFMHKKMIFLSNKMNRETSVKVSPRAFKHLWMGQCNCGYWHGVFGGFYLGHIRNAIYENLIKAEKEFDKKNMDNSLIVERDDLDLDGYLDTKIKNKHLIAVISDKGGRLLELSFKDKDFNLLNTITRCEESYHKKIREKVNDKTKLVSTIHSISRAKEEDLGKFLIYDSYEKVALVDHILNRDISLNDFVLGNNFTTLSNQRYNCKIKKNKKSAVVTYSYCCLGLELLKKITFGVSPKFCVDYYFSDNKLLKNSDFGIEFNLSILSPDDVKFKSGKSEIDGRNRGVFKAVESLNIIDSFKGISIQFNFDRGDVFIVPVYSVSSSEEGFEKSYQQTTILFIKKAAGDTFKLSCILGKGGADVKETH